MMKSQVPLFDTGHPEAGALLKLARGTDLRALEDPSFPFEEISKIAEQESWRKEVNRPVYHVHKWWAQRLGSVFRALVLGTFSPRSADILELFYKPSRIDGAIVFDPFMGSGTTLGEALKLGGRVIGQDINPVAFFLVKNALNLPRRDEVMATYKRIEADTAPQILEYYVAELPNGRRGQVLYFFWVKVVNCPYCGKPVDLFRSYVFVQNAYPKRLPEVRIVCPRCSSIHTGKYGSQRSECPQCGLGFNPLAGPAGKSDARCTGCEKLFRIVDAVRRAGRPPEHRLYAKLVLASDGQKMYVAADERDRALYARAEHKLFARTGAYPTVAIKPGYNTKQALNYCYRSWHEMFNARQLLCLGILADRIRSIPDERQRELFCCLFSGALEFNNMFASYKGEGTGAVRHMFSHHVLKPERTPIEANIWGTPKSSGAFSTLFKSRILRAIEYAENPFEVKLDKAGPRKVFGLSEPLAGAHDGRDLHLRCGDSSHSGLAAGSVDAVITDPPFFDNVHYSELADFFHVWQRHILGQDGFYASDSTRAVTEVQHSDASIFEQRLARVWAECGRVLKPDGLLVFTFHHSRAEGWRAVLGSLVRGGFRVVRVHPIRSEMSVAMPKHQAKEPITLDVVFVCRKLSGAVPIQVSSIARRAKEAAGQQLKRLTAAGFELSLNDVRVLVMANAVQLLSSSQESEPTASLERIGAELQEATSDLAQVRGKQE